MSRTLSNFDVTLLISGWRQKLAAQIGFGLACSIAMIILRSAIDFIAPTSGPFALVYPTVLIATLFGHRLAGIVSYVVCFVWAWWFVLNTVNSFAFEDPSDSARVAINAAAALIVIILAETFRKAVRDGDEARDDEIERRIVLMNELDHRTKNNFAMVASILAIQKRDLETPEAIDALEQASLRVHMFAKAYENLSEKTGDGYPVEMRDYLNDVVERIRQGGFDDKVEFSVKSSVCALPRQTAVTIGIFVNEAVTNCAKYAFPEGRTGQIDIVFEAGVDDWHLTIIDDGVGSITVASEKSGRGASLMAALAKQVEATHEICTSTTGTRVEIHHMPDLTHDEY